MKTAKLIKFSYGFTEKEIEISFVASDDVHQIKKNTFDGPHILEGGKELKLLRHMVVLGYNDKRKSKIFETIKHAFLVLSSNEKIKKESYHFDITMEIDGRIYTYDLLRTFGSFFESIREQLYVQDLKMENKESILLRVNNNVSVSGKTLENEKCFETKADNSFFSLLQSFEETKDLYDAINRIFLHINIDSHEILDRCCAVNISLEIPKLIKYEETKKILQLIDEEFFGTLNHFSNWSDATYMMRLKFEELSLYTRIFIMQCLELCVTKSSFIAIENFGDGVHPKILINFLKFFRHCYPDKQLLFSTNNLPLLSDKTLYRPDQVVLANYNQNSELPSLCYLSDFKLNEEQKKDIVKYYMRGAFSGVPLSHSDYCLDDYPYICMAEFGDGK